jgi:4-amino-4-deoxy-L-arabinose transferase-like glycosyltransferase
LVTCVVLLGTAFGYGYYRDELYFRQLGEHPSLGYLDAGPVTPMLARIAGGLFGDSLWGLRVPSALLTALTIVVVALLAKEFGGGRGAQTVAAIGTAVSLFPLMAGHTLLTSTFDIPLSLLMILFAARALLRGDGRWWLGAGAAIGVALYNKELILLLALGIFPALLVVGPRAVYRDRYLWLGALLAVVVTAPNIVYQAADGWPQLTLTEGLARAHGAANRISFVPQQLVLLGPFLAPIWITGAIRLWRAPEWRPVRALVVGAAICGVLFLISGGRPDYTVPLLLTLFAAGSVTTVRWLADNARRTRWVAAALVLNGLFAAVVALPLLPESALSGISGVDQLAAGQVGWPELTAQVAAAYAKVPAAARASTVLLAANYGEAGALDRFGPAYRLPAVYSGHDQLYAYGPPPPSATTVVTVGLKTTLTGQLFTGCQTTARISAVAGVPTEEVGKLIQICQGPRASWATLWPSVRHVD